MIKHAIVLLTLLSVACATPPEKAPAPPTAPPTSTSTSAEMEEHVMTETKKTAAAELQCPEEQLIITCTGRDSLGGCVSIQARGCDKTLEYNFGNE